MKVEKFVTALPPRLCAIGRGLAGLAVACLTGLAGCSTHPPRATAPSWDPDGMASSAVEQLDKSGDGLIDEREVLAAPGLADAFQVLDTNGDKLVSNEEIAARLQLYEDMRTAFVRTSVVVSLDGRPLTYGFVKLIPEDFQGDSLMVATGETDSAGRVTPRSEGGSYPAMQPGFYRVELYRDKSDATPISVAQQLGMESTPLTRPDRSDFVVLSFKSS